MGFYNTLPNEMRAQKLKTFSDFLKRAEIIEHALLIITEDESLECERAILELRSLNYDLPFYELNLSDNPNLKEEISAFYDIESLPTFIYFRGKKMVSKIKGYDQSNNFSRFLSTAVHLDY
nr:thioredoxin family protein [Bacteriovorax sp. HI3]